MRQAGGMTRRDLPPLSPESARRVGEVDVAWLTTLRPDGSPHTTPVWFVFDGAVISVATAARNAKVRNLRGDPRVSVAIDGTAAAPLVAQGSATFVPAGESAAGIAEAFARKYDGWDIRDESVDGERVLVQIRVDRWLLAG
jgi:PPOX class probable F420-dependent enzyme